jgi:two-component system, NtrC family, response regulator GlrR
MEFIEREPQGSIDGEKICAADIQIKGESPAMAQVRQQILLFAQNDASVLIYGETGTGKELVARALHCAGARTDKSFIAINCGAYPNDLILNELFGHTRGAFTGASSRQDGLVALADGGTLFLDEIDSLSTSAQVVLLRFLQDRCYRPLGSSKEYSVDVRIVAATHCDLQERISDGRFRDDLFYRLDVLRMQLPPLRERREDVLTLAYYFHHQFSERYGLDAPAITAAFESWMLAYHWPGNVRELENVITRWVLGQKPHSMTAIPETSAIELFSLQGMNRYCALNMALSEAKEQVIKEFERFYVAAILKQSHGNITQAARRAGKERRAFGRLVKKYNLV